MPNQNYHSIKTENLSTLSSPTLKKSINKGGMLVAGLCLLLAVTYSLYLGFLAVSADELHTSIMSWCINIFITLIFYTLAYRSFKLAKANQLLMSSPYLPLSEQSKLLPKPLTLVIKVVGTVFFLTVAIMGAMSKDWVVSSSGLLLAIGIYITYLQTKFPKIDWVNLYLRSMIALFIVTVFIGKIQFMK